MTADDEIKQLVVLRLQSWPADAKIIMGSGKELTRDELIDHVRREDAFGKQIIEMQLRYMRSLKTGFYHE